MTEIFHVGEYVTFARQGGIPVTIVRVGGDYVRVTPSGGKPVTQVRWGGTPVTVDNERSLPEDVKKEIGY